MCTEQSRRGVRGVSPHSSIEFSSDTSFPLLLLLPYQQWQRVTSVSSSPPEQRGAEEEISEVRLRGEAVGAASQASATLDFLPQERTFLLSCHATKLSYFTQRSWEAKAARTVTCQPFTVIVLALSPAL